MPEFREEAFSFFTHLAGALAALVGLALLVMRADGWLAVTAFAIYGTTLTLTFVTSTLHHISHRDAGVLRRFDMSAIFLFIAGTYTPPTLLAAPRVWGVPILVTVWVLALLGIFLLWFRPRTPRLVSLSLYLGLGWLSVVGIWPLSKVLPGEAIALIVAGGVVYTIGAIVYGRKWPDPLPKRVGYHGLWHVFVLVAAGLHFAMMWLYIPTS